MQPPTIDELTTAIYLMWLRACGGMHSPFPAPQCGCGPSYFRRVLRADLRGLLRAYFEDDAATVLPAYRPRAAAIAAWLACHELPTAVAAYDPTAGDRYGDPPCCELDPLYYDVEAHNALALAGIRHRLASLGWLEAATAPVRICEACQTRLAHVEQSGEPGP
jgi:hypothetical protein